MAEIILEIEKVPYTQLANQIVWDRRLSLRAVGLFAVLRAQGDLQKHSHKQIKISLDELAKKHIDGRASIKAGVKELQDYGYLRIEKLRTKGKFIGYKWTVTTGNQSDKTESAQMIPQVEKQPTVNFRTNPLAVGRKTAGRKSAYGNTKNKDIKKINMSKDSSVLGSKLYTRVSQKDFKRLAETLNNLRCKIAFEDILETLIDKSIEFIFIENDSRIRKHYKKNILDISKPAVIKSVLAEYKHEKDDKPFQVIEKIYTLTCEILAVKLSR